MKKSFVYQMQLVKLHATTFEILQNIEWVCMYLIFSYVHYCTKIKKYNCLVQQDVLIIGIMVKAILSGLCTT